MFITASVMKVYCVQSKTSFRITPQCAGPKLRVIIRHCLHFHLTCSLQNSPFWFVAESLVTLERASGRFSTFILFDILAAFVIVTHFQLPEIFSTLGISETISLVFLLSVGHAASVSFACTTSSIVFVFDPSKDFLCMSSSVSWLQQQLCAKEFKTFISSLIVLLFEIIAIISSFILFIFTRLLLSISN